MRIHGRASVNGATYVPGDKSISHRVALLASIADGPSEITGFASSADCWATIDCVRRLGIEVENHASRLIINGKGLQGYRPASQPLSLDAGNSGSTIRMIAGLLAGQRFTSIIDGDASLKRRPMRRIIEPLTRMGAHIQAANENYPPLHIEGRRLAAIDYASPVASAQVKTCVLLAGLLAKGKTSVSEPAASRNHTELMLKEFQSAIELENHEGRRISVEGGRELTPVNYHVPGDLSSAAFLVAAASILPDSKITVSNVSLNPTRSAFIEVLCSLNADIVISSPRIVHGEAVGTLEVSSRGLMAEPGGTVISGTLIPNLIDEIPILAVVGTQIEGRLEVREARELRIKESDRLRTIVDGVREMGGHIEEFDDGFAVEGPQRLGGGRVETAGDHRIAMAFTIAGLAANGTTEIMDADSAAVSFPEFYDVLKRLVNTDDAISE